MHVRIKGEDKDIYVQTITLQPQEGEVLHGFHCLTCGNFHQKIGGAVSKIYPFNEPSSQVPAIGKCRKCGSEYIFQTHEGYTTDPVKVILHPIYTDQSNYFYCYRGKHLILEYSNNTIHSYVDNKTKATPFITRCSHPECSINYLISDIL